MSEKSYLYLISDGTNVKVGVSKNPHRRIKQLQTGSLNKLEMLECYCLPADKVYKLEKVCHARLQSRYRKHGEWFKAPNVWDLTCTVEMELEGYIIED